MVRSKMGRWSRCGSAVPFEVRNQFAVVNSVQWMIDTFHLGTELEVGGWAFSPDPENAKIRVGGRTVEASLGLPSPDLGSVFWAVEGAERSRFTFKGPAPTFDEPLVPLEFCPEGRSSPSSTAHRWFVFDPAQEPTLPATEQIGRVINDPSDWRYRVGGATVYGRLGTVLSHLGFGGFDHFPAILDWGCGAGRLTRYLARSHPMAEVWGVDIDDVNISWCRRTLDGATFASTPMNPPLPFEDARFDLAVGVSVLTHLREPQQDRWLEELARVLKPGGVALLTIQGRPLMCLNGVREGLAKRIERQGFLVTGENPQINLNDGGGNHYYVDVFHTHEYVRTRWAGHFEILDILEGAGLHQDVVVLQR